MKREKFFRNVHRVIGPRMIQNLASELQRKEE